MVLVLMVESMKVICTYGLQVGPECEKDQFYNKMPCEWDLRNLDKMFFCLDDFNGHAERRINGYVSVRGGHGIGRRNDEGRRLLEFLMKSSYGWQRCCLKKKSRGR